MVASALTMCMAINATAVKILWVIIVNSSMMCAVLFPARTMALVSAATTNVIISAAVYQVRFLEEVGHNEYYICVCVCVCFCVCSSAYCSDYHHIVRALPLHICGVMLFTFHFLYGLKYFLFVFVASYRS